jgi:activator of HSP90 ATPase
METREVRQTVVFKGSPHDIYEILMDSKKHSQLAGETARISRKAGGKFRVGDYIEGENIELVEDKKIVQSWRGSDWPEGHYSRATFMLRPVSGGTRLTFNQTGVPAEFYEDIYKGWIDYYWVPIKDMLRKMGA